MQQGTTKRTRSIILKVTEAEDILIRTLACARGNTVSAYMRYQALYPAEPGQIEELVAARMEEFFKKKFDK